MFSVFKWIYRTITLASVTFVSWMNQWLLLNSSKTKNLLQQWGCMQWRSDLRCPCYLHGELVQPGKFHMCWSMTRWPVLRISALKVCSKRFHQNIHENGHMFFQLFSEFFRFWKYQIGNLSEKITTKQNCTSMNPLINAFLRYCQCFRACLMYCFSHLKKRTPRVWWNVSMLKKKVVVVN